MVDHGENGNGGEVVDRPEDRGGPMAAEEGDHMATEATGDASAVAAGGGDGDPGRNQLTQAWPWETWRRPDLVDSGEDHRATEPDAHAKEQVEAVGPNVDPAGPSMAVEDLSAVGGGSGDVGGSDGTRGDDTGLIESPAKGKGVVGTGEVHVEEARIEEVQTTEATPVEIREEDIAFRPPAATATSSRHVPITYADIAEHAPDEILARVLENHLEIGEYVLKAKEDRARAIEETEAAARAEREAERERVGPEGLAANMEAEEREAEEAQGPKVSAVAEAGALKRPEFSEETYTLSRSHLFVPSGFAGYKPPQQTDYDLELMLRDPGVHIANTWAEAEQRDIRGFGGPCSSLALYIGLPPRVGELVDTASFREFILTLTVPVRNDHAVHVALAERWRDTSNTFHLPPGEMTLTPSDFAAITGLRVGGEPIPFDSGIHADPAALEWFLGEMPQVERKRRDMLDSYDVE
ncbi:hypothetical protein RHMOL_Rhmol03G0118200 [Rhododendron molle]|uniref:Uncharacterized protein n=1 Tax=Rhododendron molle TaxID=49168 RepID=A0ACC0PCX6_RHOML|nr:hypothetical protein RHMOL_Rhmol03G0118200 [Rhododendron molle]